MSIRWKSRKSTGSGLVDQVPPKTSGYVDLEPEAAPAAGRMAVEQAGLRVGHQGEGLLEVGNELLDERLAPRPVGGAVGEDMVAGAAIRVQEHADQVLAEAHPRARRHHARHVVVAAEARDDVERRAASRSGFAVGRMTAARCLIGRW